MATETTGQLFPLGHRRTPHLAHRGPGASGVAVCLDAVGVLLAG